MKIRTRLILSFLAIIIIPFLVLFSLTFILNSNVIDIPYLDNLEEFSVEQANLMHFLETKYRYDTNVEQFSHQLSDFNDAFDRIFIVQNDKIIFDNEQELINQDRDQINDLYQDKSDYSENLFLDLENNDKAQLVIFPNEKYQNVEKLLFYFPLILLGIFITVIIVVIIVMSKFMSESVKKPLEKINEGIDEILHGNFDYEIESENNNNEINRLIKKFNTMKKQIRNNINSKNEYERAKKELLASITHDLRTPLSSIKGYVEALQDGLAKDKETYDRYLNIINEKSKKLDHLIDDLFILSKMDLDDFSFNKEFINSEIFLKNYLKIKQEEFKDSEIKLIVKKPLIAAIINIDSHRISQVLENLIENAKKFTQDYIKISTDIDENYLVINIEDNGIGIKPKDKKDIFKLFYKIDKSRSNPDTSGSGIGLSICKRIMDAHNGKIDLTSDENITVFKIFFPIHTEEH